MLMDEIIQKLIQFDRARNWNEYEQAKSNEEKIRVLEKLIVNLVGELGEFANEVKKGRRENELRQEKMKEELADTFIFLLKLALTLEMNLKEETLKKIKVNEERFKHYVEE